MAVKEDRRIRRTKKLLQKSLAELMGEKEFKDITVKDITERADVNRGTFYLHYCDTYDLLQKIEDGLILDFEEMLEHYEPTGEDLSSYPMINQIFDYVLENLEICRILLNSNSSAFVEKLIRVIADRGFAVTKNLGRQNKSKEVLARRFQFIAYGILGVMSQWLLTDMKNPPKEEMAITIDDILRALL